MRPIVLRTPDRPIDEVPHEDTVSVELLDDSDTEAIETDEPDEFDLPLLEPVVTIEDSVPQKLLSLEEALNRIPVSLRKEMEDLLRADFRQVRSWKPVNRHG